MKKYGKFAALIVVVVGTLVWLATAGMKENQTYYKTIQELAQMGPRAYGQRTRVAARLQESLLPERLPPVPPPRHGRAGEAGRPRAHEADRPAR